MKELLIIRSVSFQQLDQNLLAIRANYPDDQISILTHEHGVPLAKKYKNLENVYVYPFTAGFKFNNPVRALNGKRFERVIIPVTNLTGAGFFNVLLFSLTIQANQRLICNVRSELKEIRGLTIVTLALKNGIIAPLSLLLTALSLLIVIPLLPLKLLKLQTKGNGK